jgi:glycosyltransferase involved in cell wall biosynthesis
MGMGAAVVSADCPSGPADIITDGVDGRLVPVDDVPRFAAVMAELMDSPQARARLGAAALGVRARFRQENIMVHWNQALFADGGTENAA